MKYKRNLISIAMAALVLVAIVAVATTSVSAATGRQPVKASDTTVGAPIGSAPAIVATANTENVFVKGYDGALWIEHWDSTHGWTWPDWFSLGGQMTGDPSAAISANEQKVTVSVRGTSGAVWTKSSTDGGYSWGTWTNVGGNCAAGTGPATYIWPNGDRLGWFITDSATKQVMHLYKDNLGNTVGWEALGGYATSSPGATSPDNGAVEVFVRGGGGGCWYRFGSMGGFTGWNEVAGAGMLADGTGPAVTTLPWNGRLNVFVTGVSGGVWRQVLDGAGNWNANWDPIGGVLTSSPSASAYTFVHNNLNNVANNWIEVQARGGDGNVWENEFLQGWGWYGWFLWDTGP